MPSSDDHFLVTDNEVSNNLLSGITLNLLVEKYKNDIPKMKEFAKQLLDGINSKELRILTTEIVDANLTGHSTGSGWISALDAIRSWHHRQEFKSLVARKVNGGRVHAFLVEEDGSNCKLPSYARYRESKLCDCRDTFGHCTKLPPQLPLKSVTCVKCKEILKEKGEHFYGLGDLSKLKERKGDPGKHYYPFEPRKKKKVEVKVK